jgi:putative Holliday junction resolvase
VRILALDLGTRRIGVAVSDATETLASPRPLIERSGDRPRDHRRIADVVAEEEAGLVLVGMPLSLDGGEGPAAAAARAEVDELRGVLAVPVEVHDERLTTVTAHRLLAEQGLDSRERRSRVDGAAAAVLLQAWLDGRRAATRHADRP